MENLESLLRDELDPGVAPRSTSAAEVVATVRRLRRRRTTTAIATAVCVIIVAVLSVLLVPRLSAPVQPAVTPTVFDTAAFDRMYGSAYRTTGVPFSGGFIDANRGYLLMLRCPDKPKQAADYGDCTVRLDVTTDATAFTAGPPLPGLGAATRLPDLWVFDDGTLVLQDSIGRWVSHDSGQNWGAVSRTTAGSLASIPDGAQLVADPGSATEAPMVVTPDGKSYTLSSVLPGSAIVSGNLDFPYGDPIDGVFFLNHGADLILSTDRGATWQTADSGDAGVSEIVGSDGRALYGFSALGKTPGEPVRPKILVSQDRGLSWSTVAIPPLSPLGPNDNQDIGPLTMAVLPSGGLLVADSLRLWRLPVGGSALDAIPTDGTLGVLSLGGVVLRLHTDGSTPTFQVSSDGAHWHPATLG
jgi:hypothetical protein